MIRFNIYNQSYMKNLFVTIGLVCFATVLFSQERYFDERYISSQTFLNPVLVNPGATGDSDYHRVIASYRNKWASFEDSPKSFILSYDGPIGNRVGFGAMLLTDAAGALETTKGQLSLSYTIDSPTNKVGFGIATEYISHGIKSSVLSNQILDVEDIYLFERLNGADYFGASFGVQGLYDNKIIYGLTMPGLLSSRLEDRVGSTDEKDFGYILNLGYKWLPSNSDLVVEPSIWVKSLNNVPTHIDVNILMRFLDEKFFGGLTYRVGADETLGFTIGTRINSFNFYYSYNVSRHDFQTYNNGSHELSIRFDIGRKDNMVTTPPMDDMMMKDNGAEDEIMKARELLKNN